MLIKGRSYQAAKSVTAAAEFGKKSKMSGQVRGITVEVTPMTIEAEGKSKEKYSKDSSAHETGSQKLRIKSRLFGRKQKS